MQEIPRESLQALRIRGPLTFLEQSLKDLEGASNSKLRTFPFKASASTSRTTDTAQALGTTLSRMCYPRDLRTHILRLLAQRPYYIRLLGYFDP